MNFLDEGLKMLDGGFFTGCYPIHGVNGKVHLREEVVSRKAGRKARRQE